MRKRTLKNVSTGSMADIAFLLLVFWLMTTSLTTEQGLLRQLPSLDKNEIEGTIHDRNVLSVLVNFKDQILVENEEINIDELKGIATEFILNGGVFNDGPINKDFTVRNWLRKDIVETKISKLKDHILTNSGYMKKAYLDTLKKFQNKKIAIDHFGEFKALRSDAIISIQNDKKTSYNQYIQVQSELNSAINDLRDNLSLKHFGKSFSELDQESEQNKIIAIRQVFPQRISEAEFKKQSNDEI